jgi:radical SAM-linked protein
LRYTKTGRSRFVGQLEAAQAFARAVRRAGLPAAYSAGFHPHLKLSFQGALPLGVESLCEEAYLTLAVPVEPQTAMNSLNDALPEGMRVEEMVAVARRHRRPPLACVTYRVSNLPEWELRTLLAVWSRRLDDPLVRKTKSREVSFRLSDVLRDIRRAGESSVDMDLMEGGERFFRPVAVLRHLLGEAAESLSRCRVCKTAITYTEVEDACRAHHQC